LEDYELLKEGFRYDPDAKYLLTRNGREVAEDK